MHTLHADWKWGRLANGFWYVEAVYFSTDGYIPPPPPPDPPDPDPPPPIQRDVFDQYLNENTYPDDVRRGNDMVEQIKNKVSQEAKKDSHLAKNPVSAPSVKNMGKTFKDVAKGGGIPARTFFKMAVGSWLEAVRYSQAPEIAKVRRLAYAWFIEGLLDQITLRDSDRPQSDFEKKYFELGRQAAQTYTARQRYQIQLALLYYYQRHPGSGWRIPHPKNWAFDDYKRHWDPTLIGEALFNQLFAAKYSIDD
jgi:hypothetical protein